MQSGFCSDSDQGTSTNQSFPKVVSDMSGPGFREYQEGYVAVDDEVLAQPAEHYLTASTTRVEVHHWTKQGKIKFTEQRLNRIRYMQCRLRWLAGGNLLCAGLGIKDRIPRCRDWGEMIRHTTKRTMSLKQSFTIPVSLHEFNEINKVTGERRTPFHDAATIRRQRLNV